MPNRHAKALVCAAARLPLIFMLALSHGNAQTAAVQTTRQPANQPVLTLADLERMALQANPTLVQAEAAILAAEGRRVQAGLWPNPVVGYRGEEFSPRAFNEKSEHYGFINQPILLGGKLGKASASSLRKKSCPSRKPSRSVTGF